jgi:hypothetical protein
MASKNKITNMEQISFDTIAKEGVVMQEPVLWHNRKLDAETGMLFLTNKRIAFKRDINPLTGIFVKLFYAKRINCFEQDIPLEKIKNISNASLGMNQNMLVLSSTDNNNVKFLVKNFNQWQDILLELILKNKTHLKNQY